MTKSVWLKDFKRTCPTYSPWGGVQDESCAKIGNREFHFVHTAGHGGLWLSPEDRLQMPVGHGREWWEEDCEAAIPVWWFCRTMVLAGDESEFVALCTQSVKAWNPDIYEALTGEVIPLEESHVKWQRKFDADNAENFVVRSAFGSWAHWVPDGMVGVFARKAKGEEACFLIPAAEYAKRGGDFVVDPDRHQRIPTPVQP
ncbi:DUF7007 domain-containing protein [Roseicella sp. DB1501]|uniref:DUF7007 domain-containing protein n=1 Tax=Roseicella sp. DB1501 TaxID=2730925 RepID=UPI0014931060|nr:hypothetical protein [Roseicella sp. DB1501]NOG70454.1 hypothetical protein [Roseicella sp. DB1501]